MANSESERFGVWRRSGEPRSASRRWKHAACEDVA